MNDWDMVEASVNGYPTGKPKRDIVPTDGMKITVGNRTVTIYLTPGQAVRLRLVAAGITHAK